MPTVLKSVLVEHTAREMFDLVDAVERYPEFLPWCKRGTVVERTPEVTRARIDVDYRGLKTHFTTVNRKHDHRRMDLDLAEGPFEMLTGRWSFTPIGESGCRVEFKLEYQMASAAMSALLAPVFGHMMETLVERFVARADEAKP
jgi:ribosome-associated toxin RatA of RatAB toxin-antitoxin module